MARTADYPQITVDGEEQRTLFSNRYGYVAPYGGSWWWVGDLRSHLTWSLDFWGKQAALIGKAHGLSAAAGLDAAAARSALAGLFAQTYVALDLAHQNLTLPMPR